MDFMQWWPTFLERWNADPWWVLGILVLFGVLVGFYAFSFFRQLRSLGWFYVAGLFCAVVFLVISSHLSFVLEWLTSFRSDWSLIYLAQTMSFQAVVSELVLYHLYYGILGVSAVLTLALFSIITFQWNRLTIFFQRVCRQSWFILFFSILTFLFHRILSAFLEVRTEMMIATLQLLGFLFVFQLIMRLLDSARLESPRVFLEFFFAIGLGFLFLRFIFVGAEWFSPTASIHSIFFEQLFVFFLVVLMTGLLISFALRAFFLSPFSFAQFRSFFPHAKKTIPSQKEWYVSFQLMKGLLAS